MEKHAYHMTTNKEQRCAAMIFDLDGTLIDSLDDIADAANSTLAFFNMPTHPRDSYRLFVGNGVQVLLQRAMPTEHRKHHEDEIIKVFKDCYKRHLNRKTAPYDGIAAVLNRLAQQQVKLAVLSNKPDEFVRSCTDTYFPDISFAAAYGQRLGTPQKPDPYAAIKIAEELHVSPDRCAFVGDSSVDMETGKAAGMFCIGVSWGFRESDELLTAGADVIIDLPEELIRYAFVGH